MRRPVKIVVATVVAALFALGPATTAVAAPTPTPTPTSHLSPSPPPYMAGTPLCTVTDPRATELSGLIATPTGYVSQNDGDDDPSKVLVFYLDQSCKVVRTQSYPTPARDPEDLAQAPDGTLWVSDTGDNVNRDARRPTVALWQLPKSGGDPVIYRLTYPDGPHDAEALFFTPKGVPVIVTKEITGISAIYEPTGPLQAQTTQGVALKKVGTFEPISTGVPTILGRFGEVLVTGAATSPDRRKVALRTYSAVYEWDVPDGDPVKAITTGLPRVTPLPNEPQGEAIAYTVDGHSFLTLSDESGPTTIREYVPSNQTLPSSASPTAAAPPALARFVDAIPVWVLAAVIVVGLGLAAAGLYGLVRSRRSNAEA
jgi:hypothetical protein